MVWVGKLAGLGRGFRVQPVGHEAQGLFLIVSGVRYLIRGAMPGRFVLGIFVEILPPDLTSGLFPIGTDADFAGYFEVLEVGRDHGGAPCLWVVDPH